MILTILCCLIQEPITIDIDRKFLFDTVSKKLGLTIDDKEILEIRPNDYSCKLQVSGITCNDSQQRTTKTFYGDFAPTPSHATQNAYNEVLKYLTSENIIAINDYNYPALLETKKDLDETTAHLMIANYVETQFDMSLSCVKSGYNIILSKLDDIFIKLSDVLPITVSHQSDEENNRAPFNMEYTGPADPNEPCAFLAKFLVDLRKTTISLM